LLGLQRADAILRQTPRVTGNSIHVHKLWAATAPKGDGTKEVVSGIYYEPVGTAGGLTMAAMNADLASELWDWTQKELMKQGFEVAI
jgi:hypothetical protein